MTGWPWLRTPDATRQLDAMTREFAAIDQRVAEEERARHQRELNEEIFLRATRRWFEDQQP